MTAELEQLLQNLKLRRILEIYAEQLRAADKDETTGKHFHFASANGAAVDYYAAPPSAPSQPPSRPLTVTFQTADFTEEVLLRNETPVIPVNFLYKNDPINSLSVTGTLWITAAVPSRVWTLSTQRTFSRRSPKSTHRARIPHSRARLR
jgi:hypothetical protein